jgi:PASTA domain-containing protein
MDSPVRRVAAIATVAFLTAVPFAFASNPRRASAMPKAPLRPATRILTTLVVPEVQGQPYVFAEGALEDAGFSWHVAGGNGFAANTVVSQSPAPGTRVLDTGAPLVTLTVERNRVYGEHGKPSNKSPYRGTAVRRATS